MRIGNGTLVVAMLAAAALGQSAEPGRHSPATLRVGVWTLWHDRELSIAPASGGSATLNICGQADACASTPLREKLQVRGDGGRVALAKGREAATVSLSGPVTLAAHGETLTLRNPLRISARNGQLVLAATLPVESYVERVVASESGAADTPESLKALAIVVRSFALHQAHGHADYDLCDSTHCQLLHWAGNPAHRAAAHAATLATAGETLWYQGRRAAAWFHQNCGGRTATPSEVWPARGIAWGAMPWLVSRADPYCTADGTRQWAADLTLADLTAALETAGLVRAGWNSLAVSRRGESGRAVTLLVGAKEVSAEDFRLAVGHAMGWNRILSDWFEVARQGDHFVFHGRGSGHGVGLCQAGAAAMSALGRDSTQILGQYFPGAVAADEASGLSWQSLSGQGFALETLGTGEAGYLPQLVQALAEAQSLSGLQPDGLIRLRAFRSTEAFRNATLAPGWVAAFTEGNWIGVQPLSTLASRKLLVPVLRHEFLHALVEAHAAPGTPLWFREGLVEAWSEGQRQGNPPVLRLDQVDQALAHASSEAQSGAAHRAAGFYAAQLLARYGRLQVVAWLETGLPAAVSAALR